ncbi:unnamed protein product [Pleuronectes platessa]|uniref:Uncharacterized protein n=1 Tax=Pleuronectes platessa TaxID=8262 RepID=A0A9N7VLR0_PLEPL|nr:unnamed protein product [Pleuronectes platessa]
MTVAGLIKAGDEGAVSTEADVEQEGTCPGAGGAELLSSAHKGNVAGGGGPEEGGELSEQRESTWDYCQQSPGLSPSAVLSHQIRGILNDIDL